MSYRGATSVSEVGIRLKSIAQMRERAVIGIFNAPAADTAGELGKPGEMKSRASATFRDEALRVITDGGIFSGLGMSQPGVVIARGLRQLKTRLIQSYPLNHEYRDIVLS